MTELELRKKATAIVAQYRDNTISDEEILRQIREEPEVVHAECLSGANLFLAAVLHSRFVVAKALSEMGADIHWTCKASMFNGNALNVAHSPQEADWLLDQGVVIEKTCRSILPSRLRIRRSWRHCTMTRICCSIG